MKQTYNRQSNRQHTTKKPRSTPTTNEQGANNPTKAVRQGCKEEGRRGAGEAGGQGGREAGRCDPLLAERGPHAHG